MKALKINILNLRKLTEETENFKIINKKNILIKKDSQDLSVQLQIC
jgi:hypothetical protein